MGQYQSVVRMYDKYQLAHESSRTEYADRVRLQFEFARDNLISHGEPLGDSSRINA